MSLNYVETLHKQVSEMATGFVAALPGLAVALVILIVTWLVSKSAAMVARRLVGRSNMRESLKQLTETMIRIAIWGLGISLSLTVALPDLSPANLVAGLGVGALAIGFAFQDIFENFLAGVLIMLRDKMHIGDAIDCNGVVGKVERITLRETHIRQFSGELTIMPNSMLFKDKVQILTDVPVRREQVVVGVSYDTDLDHAAQVIREAVGSLSVVHGSHPVEVLADTFNSSSVDFLVRWWMDTSDASLPEGKDAVVRCIKKALDRADIEIPFPYITHTFKEKVPLAESEG